MIGAQRLTLTIQRIDAIEPHPTRPAPVRRFDIAGGLAIGHPIDRLHRQNMTAAGQQSPFARRQVERPHDLPVGHRKDDRTTTTWRADAEKVVVADQLAGRGQPLPLPQQSPGERIVHLQ